MLKLIMGSAGTGKTSAIINEIRQAAENNQGGRMLIVPEQYSHEAERELCRVGGDSISRFGEVFSFTGLARRIASQQGGQAKEYLDVGGQILSMNLAVKAVGSRLKVYSSAGKKSDISSLLLNTVNELKTSCIGARQLADGAEVMDGILGDKMRDLALISEAYDAIVANSHADPASRLSLLAEQIKDSFIDSNSYIYIDGFTDFTQLELNVISALLKKGANVTVCLTVDSLSSDNEVFQISRNCARTLMEAAEDAGVAHEEIMFSGEWQKADSIGYFADNMFAYSADNYTGDSCSVSLYSADTISGECEFAAAKALDLVRTTGCRWRDIGIIVRGFEDYAGILENIFEFYSVPLYINKKTDLFTKPLPMMINLLYAICEKGWDTEDVISYLGTGLSGLDMGERDLLSSYIFKWQLRGSAFMRDADWQQHPEGYQGNFDDEAREKLARINSLRRKMTAPILTFAQRSKLAVTATEQAKALAEFFADINLPEIMEDRARTLSEEGKSALGAEYAQLWGIVTNALEQIAAVLGDSPMDRESFGRLFTLMLSQYSVGTIPLSLDKVSAGDFDRMRRRNVKHLIVLGCSDTRLPKAPSVSGVFTDFERQRLSQSGIKLGAGEENELWREFSLIYNCLTMPSDSLTLCYALNGGEGEALSPAFIYKRAMKLFSLPVNYADLKYCRTFAPAPALTLAANALSKSESMASSAELAAKEYFAASQPKRLENLSAAATLSKGKLSQKAVRALYGEKIKLGASRVDKFASCKFSYFCQYGLKAKPSTPAQFKSPEIGTFIHYLLENVAREAKSGGGFKEISDERLDEIAEKYICRYVSEELNDFKEKTARFIYLFKRLCAEAKEIIKDMAQELRKSDFVPLSFELDFGKAQNLPPVEFGEGQDKISLTGIADRVDGYLHDGKLYLRVVDYKTGKKDFSLSDIMHGMGMQMLLYLFALEAEGEELYNYETVPAGIMYMPARNPVLSLDENVSDKKAEEKRLKELKRSGLVLNDEAVIEAWERGDEKKYIPVSFRNGVPSPNDVASTAQLGLLSKHINKTLADMARQLSGGSIEADPYYKAQQKNACLNCDYFDVCHFADGENGESFRHLSKLSPQKVWETLENRFNMDIDEGDLHGTIR